MRRVRALGWFGPVRCYSELAEVEPLDRPVVARGTQALWLVVGVVAELGHDWPT